MAVRCASFGDRFVGILVAKLVQRKPAGFSDLQRAFHGSRIAREQPSHLGGRLDVAFGVGLQRQAGLVDAATQPDAGQHILQPATARQVIENVVRRYQRQPERGQPVEARQVVAAMVPACSQIGQGGKISR